MQFSGVFGRFRISGVVPNDLVPELAVFVEDTRLGIDEAVRLDVINDVVTRDFEVKLFGVHGKRGDDWMPRAKNYTPLPVGVKGSAC